LPRDFDALRPHLASLKRTADDAPDFTRSVLAEVGHRKPWLDSRERRWVWVGRMAAAAAVVAVVAGVFLVQRHTDVEEIATGPRDRPIGALVRSVSNDSQRVDVRTLDGAALGRVVIAEPLARAIRISERPKRSASVWSIQRIGDPGVAGFVSARDGGQTLASFHGLAGMAGSQQMQVMQGGLASPMPDGTGAWTGSMVVPATFQPPMRQAPRFPRAD
jgi:hypothetical protein